MTISVPTMTAQLPGFLFERTGAALAGVGKQLGQRLTMQAISLLISIGISVGIYFWADVEVGDLLFWLLIISVAISVLRFVGHLVRFFRVRSLAAKVVAGPGLQVDVAGMVLAEDANGTRVSWEQVQSVRGKHRFWAPGPDLEVQWSDGTQPEPRTWTMPIIYLDVKPTLLDSALRAYSRGRFGLDLGAVDRLW